MAWKFQKIVLRVCFSIVFTTFTFATFVIFVCRFKDNWFIEKNVLLFCIDFLIVIFFVSSCFIVKTFTLPLYGYHTFFHLLLLLWVLLILIYIIHFNYLCFDIFWQIFSSDINLFSFFHAKCGHLCFQKVVKMKAKNDSH